MKRSIFTKLQICYYLVFDSKRTDERIMQYLDNRTHDLPMDKFYLEDEALLNCIKRKNKEYEARRSSKNT